MPLQWPFLYIILIISNVVYVATIFEDCDSTVNIIPSLTYTFQSVNYTIYNARKMYAAGTSCRVQYIAPHGYIIKLNGLISMDVKIRIPNCSGQGQRFYVSRNGNKNFTDADVFCGVKTIALDSVGNEISVGYVSDINGQGRFQVFATAEKIVQNNCNCGWGYFYKFSKRETSRTYKGFTSTVGILHEEDDAIVCTGVIITDKFVLSAAHCYYKSTENTAENLHVITGYKVYPSDDDPFYQGSYEIESIKIHESYVDTNANQLNDIALIKTKEFITFTRLVSPACLPFSKSFSEEDFYLRKTFEFVGWNEFVDDGSQQFLQDSLHSYSSVSNCAASFKTFNASDSHLCLNRFNSTAKHPEFPGAAAFYAACDKKALVGLFIQKINSTNLQPIVFTRVANYMPWIKSNIGNEFICNRYF